MDTRKRTSRWTTRQPENPPYRLEPGDFEILKCLARYTLSTNRDIAALTNRSYKVICRRTQKLKNWYIKVCSALNNARFYQRSPQAFHLTPRGIDKLAEIGVEVDIPRTAGQLIHRLTENQTAVSFELGCRDRGLEIIYDVDARPSFPTCPLPYTIALTARQSRLTGAPSSSCTQTRITGSFPASRPTATART
jgi:hypothetical protein